MAAALGQTITVVNKSGKVVSTSKHLVNVFKEARSAYREKKAELRASKADELDRQSRKRSTTLKDHDFASDSRRSSTSSHRSDRRRSHHDHPRSRHHHSSSGSRHSRDDSRRPSKSSKPPVERGYSDSFYVNDHPSPSRVRTQPPSPLRFMYDAEHEADGKEMVVRRHSYSDSKTMQDERSKYVPQDPKIDMDLAYGELPPPLPTRTMDEKEELRTKMSALNHILEEANCLHHSAKATIKSLEDNPDAMAAVALTMAEISNIATKLGPGVLMAMKTSFPAVVALLLSPEFLIAGGVAVGVTVVALGGYKIIKRVKAKKKLEEESEEEELEEAAEIDDDVTRIDHWRRGIADVEAASAGTSVEGEFITPSAAKDLRERGLLPPDTDTKKKSGSKRAKSTKKSKNEVKKMNEELAKKKTDLEKREQELERKEKELEKSHKQKDRKERDKAEKAQKAEKAKVEKVAAKEEAARRREENGQDENTVQNVQNALAKVFKKDKPQVIA
ncbi:MAG: hypothetical protein M1831_007260 [Alyxoria varia]|nr:MAG: hypothetical protein M1831_007260 [Alyxoria varia]